jgi:hypothetical protein
MLNFIIPPLPGHGCLKQKGNTSLETVRFAETRGSRLVLPGIILTDM